MYTPDKKILERYADVLVNFALNGGKGIKKNETVFLLGAESSKPLFMACIDAISKSGGNVIVNYLPDGADRFGIGKEFLVSASTKQLDFYPENYMKGLLADIDHYLYIYSEADPKALQGVDAKKIARRQKAMGPFMKMRDEKERAGKFSWTIGLYPTEGMAKEAELSLEEYWEQVIKACFLDNKKPTEEWKKIFKINNSVKDKLNKLSTRIDKLHVLGEDADLWIKLGEKRKWITGSGRNIPSFEIFTSPDWRGTEGWIKFNQPLFRTGNRIEGIKLVFKKGKIVQATAAKGQDVLQEMINTKNADKIGEYSLTDKRVSRITKFMANTLYDENVGGEFGNTHLAVGKSYYFDAYAGDNKK
jgi:aminopeptidase